MRKIVRFNTEMTGPTKTVTIRGVNKAMYDRFSQISQQFGGNTGQIFSALIDSYGKQYHPMLMSHGARRQFIIAHESHSVEVIKDLDELILSKEDLTEAGDTVRYFFKDVKRLVFDDTVDNKTLMKHVLRIRGSTVETKGEISRLFLKSINQGKNMEAHFDELDTELSNVTIRNVSEEAYIQFTSQCQANKIKIGDAVTQLLKRALPHFEISQIMVHDHKINPVDLIILTMHGSLEVNNQDLEDLEGRKVLFHRIKKLDFKSDVTGDNFQETVMGIYNCDNVKIPDTIPRLLRHSRVHQYP